MNKNLSATFSQSAHILSLDSAADGSMTLCECEMNNFAPLQIYAALRSTMSMMNEFFLFLKEKKCLADIVK